MDEFRFDVLIVGGSLGGVAAALRAASAGVNVCLLAETGWLGGQLTEQGVSTPDENAWLLKDMMAAPASYLFFRHLVREHYRNNFTLSSKGRNARPFCPGDCEVNNGSLSVEPRVGMEILEGLLSAPILTVHKNARAVSVEMRGDAIQSVTAEVNGTPTLFRATIILDATDLGNLLPLVGEEGEDWVIGAESRSDTGESDAPAVANPSEIQPFTFPFLVERRPSGENHTITRPDNYEVLKEQQKYTFKDGDIRTVFRGAPTWWAYRRVIAAANFNDAHFRHDIAQINTDSNDYGREVFPSNDPEADRRTLEKGRQASLGYLYWMQTECPHDENSSVKGYSELKPRGDLSGSPDGLSPAPYIRESRRIKALKTIVEGEIAAADGQGNPLQTGSRAALFPDSCGIGSYGIDIHGGTHLKTKPFQISLGALIPRRITNLLAACKNLGVTHITNGCYRVHPVEWNIGESAGALAAFCVEQNLTPRQVHENDARLRAYQRRLLQAGIPLFWWPDLSNDHPAFAAAHMMALIGIFKGNADDLNFNADEAISAQTRQILQERVESVTGRSVTLPSSVRTRGQAAIRIAQELNL